MAFILGLGFVLFIPLHLRILWKIAFYFLKKPKFLLMIIKYIAMMATVEFTLMAVFGFFIN